jgi:hypothetical protein
LSGTATTAATPSPTPSSGGGGGGSIGWLAFCFLLAALGVARRYPEFR